VGLIVLRIKKIEIVCVKVASIVVQYGFLATWLSIGCYFINCTCV